MKHAPPAEFTSGIDSRAVLLARAAALDALFQAGEISPDAAIEELIVLIGPFLPDPCSICGSPPPLHDESWCTAVGERKARRVMVYIGWPSWVTLLKCWQWAFSRNGVYLCLSREVFFGQEKTVGIRFVPRNCARRHGFEALIQLSMSRSLGFIGRDLKRMTACSCLGTVAREDAVPRLLKI
jgi:hypothetical protein